MGAAAEQEAADCASESGKGGCCHVQMQHHVLMQDWEGRVVDEAEE